MTTILCVAAFILVFICMAGSSGGGDDYYEDFE